MVVEFMGTEGANFAYTCFYTHIYMHISHDMSYITIHTYIYIYLFSYSLRDIEVSFKNID